MSKTLNIPKSSRGYWNTIISDNGKNFVGADKELKPFVDVLDKVKFETDFEKYQKN